MSSPPDAAQAFEQALQELRQALSAAPTPAVSQPVRLAAAALLARPSDPTAALTLLETARLRALSAEEQALAAWVSAEMAAVHIQLGDFTQAQPRAVAAIEALHQAGRPQEAIRAADKLVRAFRGAGGVEEAVRFAEFALGQAWPAECAEAMLGLRLLVAETRWLGGSPDQGQTEVGDILAQAQKNQWPRVEFSAHITFAAAAQAHGQVDLCLQWAERARAIAVEYRWADAYLAAAQFIASTQEQAGRLDDAYETWIRAVSALRSLLGPSYEPEGRALLAALKARWGEAQFHACAQSFLAKRSAQA